MLVRAVFILKFIYISPDIPGKKRKHSSRMRTARLTMLGSPGSVSRGCLGVSREVCVQGCMSREVFRECPRNVCPGGVSWGCLGGCSGMCVSRGCQRGVKGVSRGESPRGCVQGVCSGVCLG